MTLLMRRVHGRNLMRRKRIIGGSVWSSIWGAVKKFATSEAGKNLVRTGVSKAAEAAPGLIGRAWNWIKSKFTGKKSEDKLPEEVTTLSKKAGDKITEKVLGFIDKKLGPQPSQEVQPPQTSQETNVADYKAIMPEGWGLRPLGAGTMPIGVGISPLGAGKKKAKKSGLSSENQKVLSKLAKMGRGVKLSY